MIKKFAGLTTLFIFVSGCASMLTHQRFSDEQLSSSASAMALAMTCAEKELIPGELAYAFGYSFSQLLSVSSYNKRTYEENYSKTKKELSRIPVSEYQNGCLEANQKLPGLITEINSRYSNISRARQSDLLAMSNSAASMGNNISNFGQQQQQTQVLNRSSGFKPAVNRPNHYLVDFGGGQRICTATSSGYVRCM